MLMFLRNTAPAPAFIQDAFNDANAAFGWNLSLVSVKFADFDAAGFCRPFLSSVALSRSMFRGGTAFDLLNLLHEMLHLKYPLAGHGGGWLRAFRAIGVDYTYPGHCDDFTGWHAIQPGGPFDVWCLDFMARHGLKPQTEIHESQKDDVYRHAEAEWRDLQKVPDRVRDIGARIVSGGQHKDAALEELAKLAALDPSADPKIIALALDYAKNGHGKPCPPELDYLLDDAGRAAINAGVKRGGSNGGSNGQGGGATPSGNASNARKSGPVSQHLAVIVDLSDSMYSHLAALQQHVQAAVDGSTKCTIIGFHKRAEILNSVSDISRICTGRRSCSESANDLAAGLRLARSVRPDAAIIITDAALDIYDLPWGPQHREADRLHSGGCKRIEAVWLPQNQAVWAAEGGHKLQKCDGGEWCPVEYLNRAKDFMQQLPRGGGVLHEGNQPSNIHFTETVNAALSAAMLACAPNGQGEDMSVHCPTCTCANCSSAGGDYTYDAATAPYDSTPIGGRDMFGQNGRDYSGVVTDTLEEGAAALTAYRASAVKRAAEDAEAIQRNLHTAAQIGMDGVHTELERAALEHENHELRHGNALMGQVLTGLDRVRRSMRAQSDASLAGRREEHQAVEGKLGAILDAFGQGAMAMVTAPVEHAAPLRGGYTAPQVNGPHQSQIWERPAALPVKEYSPAQIGACRAVFSAQPYRAGSALSRRPGTAALPAPAGEMKALPAPAPRGGVLALFSRKREG
jgi:hypothetical protein